MNNDKVSRTQEYSRQGLQKLFWAFIVFIIMIIILVNTPAFIKFGGSLFLYIPEQLGFVQQVSLDEVQTISLTRSSFSMAFPKPGKYAVYTDEIELLQTALTAQSTPWLKITSQGNGQSITVSPIGRGLRPYDTPLADGRPIFHFDIERSGVYEFDYPAANAGDMITIVPDYTTGKETTITILFLVQIALIAVPTTLFLYRRRLIARSARLQVQQRKRAAMESLLQSDQDDDLRS